jgi:hypothetical protein
VILSSQRSPNNNTRLGYTQDSTPTLQGYIKKQISYADTLKNSLKREDNQAKMMPLKTVTHKQKSILHTRVKIDNINTIIRRNPPNYLFIGYCSLAIILDIRQYTTKLMDNTIIEITKDTKKNECNAEKRNYNSFSPLQSVNIGCQKYNNYGHKTSECRFTKHNKMINVPNNKKGMEEKTNTMQSSLICKKPGMSVTTPNFTTTSEVESEFLFFIFRKEGNEDNN